jgi:hypothetical protein
MASVTPPTADAMTGTPRARAGRYTFNVRVRDAVGSLATRRLTLRIVA